MPEAKRGARRRAGQVEGDQVGAQVGLMEKEREEAVGEQDTEVKEVEEESG